MPTMGGLRIDPNVSMEEIEALSITNSIKNIICELPFAGAQGGIRMDKTLHS